jgi:arylsulfatase A-like enzyme
MCGVLPAEAADKKPNILVIWGDDIGWENISAYNLGLMGYKTPNIDRIAKEGAIFTDVYAQQSCTAGRGSFILRNAYAKRIAQADDIVPSSGWRLLQTDTNPIRQSVT